MHYRPASVHHCFFAHVLGKLCAVSAGFCTRLLLCPRAGEFMCSIGWFLYTVIPVFLGRGSYVCYWPFSVHGFFFTRVAGKLCALSAVFCTRLLLHPRVGGFVCIIGCFPYTITPVFIGRGIRVHADLGYGGRERMSGESGMHSWFPSMFVARLLCAYARVASHLYEPVSG